MTDNGEQVYAVIGPPGCGKTSYLAEEARRLIAWAHKQYGGLLKKPILICSLTRAAAAEIAGRDLPLPSECVGTLHAHAFRSLNHPMIAAAHHDDFNKSNPGYTLTVQKKASGKNLDDPDWEYTGETEADQLLAQYQLARARMITRKNWHGSTRDFAEIYEQWKENLGVLDFTDLIETAYKEVDTAPGEPLVILTDEAQDNSALEFTLLRKWGKAAGKLIVVGDPYQCQPGDTRVMIFSHKKGFGRDHRKAFVKWKMIEDLDPQKDRVVSFNRRGSHVNRIGKKFKIEARFYSGRMITINIGENQTRCTPNHKWTVRINPKARLHWNVVYLMKKKNRFRVGRCILFRSPSEKNMAGSFGPAMRCYQEKGEAVWILKLCSTGREAEMWQQIISCKFGIPTTCFKDHNCGWRDKEAIDFIYEIVDESSKPAECLRFFGRNIDYPIWINKKLKRSQKMGKRIPMTIMACNLMPEWMELPVPTERHNFVWKPFCLGEKKYNGLVYSLNVEKDEHYVADGIITHNSLYCWRGAHPEIFMDSSIPGSRRKILSQSYRVPRAVHSASVRWISQLSNYEPIDYRPRDYRGTVAACDATWQHPEYTIDRAEQYLAKGKSVMMITSCSFMLRPTIEVIRNRGLPYSNPWRTRRGDWNPLTPRKGTSVVQRILDYLRLDKPTYGDHYRGWTALELYHWTDVLDSKKLFYHGVKASLKIMASKQEQQQLAKQDMDDLFLPEVRTDLREMFLDREQEGKTSLGDLLGWWQERLRDKKRKIVEYPLTVIRLHGVQAVKKAPKLYVGTAHSLKGSQADCVFVYPDLSPAGLCEWEREGPHKDNVIRMFYVALTRARETVTICNPVSEICTPLGDLVDAD